MYHWLLWRSAAQALGHNVGRVVIIPPDYKPLLISKLADGKDIQFTNHRPTLSIAVIEIMVKAQGSLWRDTEVESGSHQA